MKRATKSRLRSTGAAKRRSQHALVRRHRCQFLRDNAKPCGKLAGKHKVRVFLDSSCTHGRGWCAVWACKDHEEGKYQSPNAQRSATGQEGKQIDALNVELAQITGRVSNDVDAKCRALMDHGDKVGAVKVYRAAMGGPMRCSLREAVDYVNSFTAQATPNPEDSHGS